ncbi:MAG: hypothetical protein EAX96_04425 [Candidatus Lokiarchaeota archaeon]|nr:hypothetical protein [Candidatus Lokiarchaeota archaeon]
MIFPNFNMSSILIVKISINKMYIYNYFIKKLKKMLLMKKRILIDQSHKNLFFSKFEAENDWEKWNQSKKLFKELDFEIKLVKEINSETINLENGEIFIIGGPQKEYTQKEIEIIWKFVENLGSLLIMHNYGGDLKNKTNLNDLMKPFGIEFNNDLIHDEAHNVKGFIHGPIISNFEDSPIFFDIKKFCLLLGCSIMVKPPALEVAYSDKASYTKNYKPEDIWFDEKVGKKIVLAILNEDKKGRIVALSDLHLFSDDESGLFQIDNAKLFENILDWLSEPFISIQSSLIRINRKLTHLSKDVNLLKKRTGLMETSDRRKGPASSKLYTPEEIALKVKKIETDLVREAERSRKGELEYFSKRVRYEFIALIISVVSILISVIIVLLTIIN